MRLQQLQVSFQEGAQVSLKGTSTPSQLTVPRRKTRSERVASEGGAILKRPVTPGAPKVSRRIRQHRNVDISMSIIPFVPINNRTVVDKVSSIKA